MPDQFQSVRWKRHIDNTEGLRISISRFPVTAFAWTFKAFHSCKFVLDPKKHCSVLMPDSVRVCLCPAGQTLRTATEIRGDISVVCNL